MVKKISVILLLILSSTPAFALNKREVEKKLQVNIKTISPTPIKDISEIITEDRRIIYIDSTGKYLLLGNIIDLDNRVNLTSKKMALITKIDFGSISLKNAIKTGQGNKKIIVFQDPDCPFCRKLHKELKKLKGVKIYTFIFDQPKLHPKAYLKSKKIYCSKDPAKTLDMALNGDSLDMFKDCKTNKVDKNRSLAKRLGINGTPFIILENGSTIRGFRPVGFIENKINNL